MSVVLLVADPDDSHATRLDDALTGAGARVVRWTPAAFPSAATLSLRPAAGAAPELRLSSREVLRATETCSVFLRDAAPPAAGPWVTDPTLRHWVEEESSAAAWSLWLLADWRCVPASPTTLQAAACKPAQLAHAAACGLHVPRSLLSNDAEACVAFYEECGGRLISKTLVARRLTHDGHARFAFTHVLRRRDLTHLHALRNGPVLLQEYIAKQCELRITLVGARLFAAEVDSQAVGATRDDWRRLADPPLRWREHALPAGVQASLLRLAAQLGLRFGAIDMILTPTGDYVFLELNPLGDWLFVEDRLDLPITAALVALLLEREP